MKNSNTIYHQKADWSALSLNRKALLGIATLLVVLHHFTADIYYSTSPEWLRFTAQRLFACVIPYGVSVFLFLSGAGLYYSMKKGQSLRTFYKNRYLTLLLTYALWGLVYWIVADVFLKDVRFLRLIADYTLITFWKNGDHSFWYIAVICVFYLPYPVFYHTLRAEAPHRTINLLLYYAGTAAVCFLLQRYADAIYNHIEIGLLRLPVFLTGCYFGASMYEKRAFSRTERFLCIAIVLIRLFCIYRYLRYGDWQLNYQRVINDAFSVVLCIYFAKLPARFFASHLMRLFEKLSIISLELYLVHLSMWNILCTLEIHGPITFLIMLTAAFFFSIGLHRVITRLRARITHPV